jgi:hypothetical protein
MRERERRTIEHAGRIDEIESVPGAIFVLRGMPARNM